ncbi:MAG: histidinol dehydrogenase [Betaproteobacteria bacterium]
MPEIRRLDSQAGDFAERLAALTRFEASLDERIEQTVADILLDVRRRGDAAVIEYTNRFDNQNARGMSDLEIAPEHLARAYAGLPAAQRDALDAAARRIRLYHEYQKAVSWSFVEEDGTRLGQEITPIERVGLYVPGGRAAYPSSVLMNAIPAKVAGVGELIMTVPTPGGERNPLVLAAAHIGGIDRVLTIGGAQAIAALAYGTQSIPQVDKIVGPGNAYVAAAKRRVFGVVGIDMIAGPSEILVIADDTANPDWVAMDLFSQAEHDEVAQAILLSPSAAMIQKVAAAITRLLPEQPRRAVIAASLANRGALIKVAGLADACAIANSIAPEHMELAVADPEALVPLIRNAGAIFLGHYASESLGDYCAGPNHVLPTARSARFSSPLGVYDFQKRSSLIAVSAKGAQTLGALASILAHGEGLAAHARAAEMRIESTTK